MFMHIWPLIYPVRTVGFGNIFVLHQIKVSGGDQEEHIKHGRLPRPHSPIKQLCFALWKEKEKDSHCGAFLHLHTPPPHLSPTFVSRPSCVANFGWSHLHASLHGGKKRSVGRKSILQVRWNLDWRVSRLSSFQVMCSSLLVDFFVFASCCDSIMEHKQSNTWIQNESCHNKPKLPSPSEHIPEVTH